MNKMEQHKTQIEDHDLVGGTMAKPNQTHQPISPIGPLWWTQDPNLGSLAFSYM